MSHCMQDDMAEEFLNALHPSPKSRPMQWRRQPDCFLYGAPSPRQHKCRAVGMGQAIGVSVGVGRGHREQNGGVQGSKRYFARDHFSNEKGFLANVVLMTGKWQGVTFSS